MLRRRRRDGRPAAPPRAPVAATWRSDESPPDRPTRQRPTLDDPIITFSPTFACQCPRALKVLVTATVVGLLTGFLGVGGGFLVVPPCVLALALPMDVRRRHLAGGHHLDQRRRPRRPRRRRHQPPTGAWSPSSPPPPRSVASSAPGSPTASTPPSSPPPSPSSCSPSPSTPPPRPSPPSSDPSPIPEPRSTSDHDQKDHTMTSTATRRHARTHHRPRLHSAIGPARSGRLGVWVTDHARLTTVVWLLADRRPRRLRAHRSRPTSPAPAGRPTAPSPSRCASWPRSTSAATPAPPSRSSCTAPTARSPRAQAPTVLAEVTAMLEDDRRIADVVQPQPGATLSQDGRTAVAPRRRRRRPQRDGPGRRRPQGRRSRTSPIDGVEVNPTGASLLWSDFNEANLDAMLKSEMFSWPVTLAILVLAFGALVAAGLPLILTLAGPRRLRRLAGADQRARPGLHLGDELRDDVRPRPRHRLRAVPRRPLPGRPDGRTTRTPRQAIAETMDTAGKAVLLSGATVLISLSAVMLVPVPVVPLDGRRHHARRSSSCSAATLTLLPAGAVQARPPDQQARAALGAHRRAPLAEVRRLGRAALEAPGGLRPGRRSSCCSPSPHRSWA